MANNGTEDKNKKDETVTVRELEERSNRSSWMIMYVFMGILLVLFIILGVAAVTG